MYDSSIYPMFHDDESKDENELISWLICNRPHRDT